MSTVPKFFIEHKNEIVYNKKWNVMGTKGITYEQYILGKERMI